MATQYIQIYYGPCDSFHTFCHKPQKLKGIRDELRRLGFRVDLKAVDHFQLCLIELCDYEVFRCNIKHLAFNMYYKHDPIAERAISAVLRARDRMNHACNYIWIKMLIENCMIQKKYGPKNYFLQKPVEIQPEYILPCLKCCEINLSKKDRKELKDSESEEFDLLFKAELQRM